MSNRSFFRAATIALIGVSGAAGGALGQNPPKPKRQDLTGAQQQGKEAKPDSAKKAEKARVTHFFDAPAPVVAMSLTFNYKKLRGDRDATKSPWRAAVLTVADSNGVDTLPIRIRTRGIWRLNHCDMPPIRLHFSNAEVKSTLLKGLSEPKLINYCKDFDDYEQYILSEYQVNRVYNLLTPNSHRVRLVKMTYYDSADTKKPIATRSAFIEEEPEVLANRIHGMLLKQKGAGPDDVEPYQSVMFGVFNYMIGNTDFAISVLHNAELVSTEKGDLVPITYDFDFSGAVNTRYSAPDSRLGIKSVKDRLYRGYCAPDSVFAQVIDIFKQKKDAIYALYHDEIGKMQDQRVVDETLRYYDGFYDIINDPRRAKGNINDACIGRR